MCQEAEVSGGETGREAVGDRELQEVFICIPG